jgi:hypothetical protein
VARHLNILSILVRLWGVLAILVGVSLLLLAAGALAILLGPDGQLVALAAGVTIGAFVVTGTVALVWGAAHVWAALLLGRRHPWGRTMVLGLAIVNLVVLPFGTALGSYALWTLLTEEGRRLFAPAPAAPSS